MPNITKPLELVQLLLMENTSKDEFLDFQKRFQSFIDQSPSFLHSVGKEGFFPSFFFGAFAILLDSGLADFGDVKVKGIYFRFDDHGTLKLAVLTEDSQAKSEKIIYIAVSDKENHKPKFDPEELTNIHFQVFPNRGRDQQSKSRYENRKETIYSIAIGKERKVACDVIEKPKIGLYDSEQAKKFTLIKSEKENLKDLIEELANKGHGQVMNTMKEVLDYITGVYGKYKDDRGIKKQFESKESNYHGFLAGFLMNFKYRFHLKLYLELFAGKGYADIILLVRGADKSLNAVPIIIELKAGTDEKNTPQEAMKQVRDYVKGFFSNFTRMVTAAEEVVCVGLNFEMNRVSQYSLYAQKFLEREGNSVVEKSLSISQDMVSATKAVNKVGLENLLKTRRKEVNKSAIEERLGGLGEEEVDKIIKNQLIGLFGKEDKVNKQRLSELEGNLPNICANEIIRKQLEYLYYGIVWSNGGSDNIHYVSQFILGQLILIPDVIKKMELGKYILIYNRDDKMVEGTQTRSKLA